MLNLLGPKTRVCDGVSRRQVLQAGMFSMFGPLASASTFSLANLLHAEEAQGASSNKAVINIFLAGGPPHQDMWEIKTEAPSEIRGPFKEISTAVPGIRICEMFPKIAALADKFTFIRSVVGCEGRHNLFQCHSGRQKREMVNGSHWPAIGPAAAHLLGQRRFGIPPTVALAQKTRHVPWSDPGGAGFLGAAVEPFRADGEGFANLTLRDLTQDRFAARKRLLDEVAKHSPLREHGEHPFDSYTQQAFDILSSNSLADAFDVTKEPQKVQDRYGNGEPYKFQYDGAPTVNDHLLIARRLVERGVRAVTLSYGRWDSHGDNEGLVRDHGPKLDQCVSALVQDLDERGMLDDTTVVVWGEFGRTPKINDKAGRDHWPKVSCALLAGGGMNHGQVIGETTRDGGEASDDPIHLQNIVATIYHNLGIRVGESQFAVHDRSGRPHFLLPGEHQEPIKRLVT